MTVRAKFYVSAVNKTFFNNGKDGGGSFSNVTLEPVYSAFNGKDAKENEAFWDATPSGKIELGINNQDAAKQFTVGQQFYIDFTPAE